MSSRNQYLSDAERPVAARINAVLQDAAAAVRSGADMAGAEAAATQALGAAGFDVDYVAIRSRDLRDATGADNELVALAAARLGWTRLIDNVEFTRSGR
jgi:pantoate--beta-alanine ligase